MPYKDGEGNTVEKGAQADYSRVVSVATDGAETLVQVDGLTSVDEASAELVDPSAGQGSDGINTVDETSGASNEVGVTLTSTNTGNLDVRVDATGY